MWITLLAAALVLGPVIVFHEFGHFIVAKLAGIYVKTFSIGFGPKLLKRRFGETQYALSAIPLGGYVKMAGDSVADERRAEAAAAAAASPSGSGADDDGAAQGERAGEEFLYARDDVDDADIPEHRYFRNKSLAVRLAVVTAGPIANFVLAFAVLTGVLHHEGMRVPPTTTLAELDETSREYAAGLRGGDDILRVGDRDVTNALELQDTVLALGPEPFPVRLRRAGQDTTVVLAGVERQGEALVFPLLQPRMSARLGLVKKGGPAWKAGLRPGDRIVAIQGQPVQYYDQLADLINPAIGEALEIEWVRDGEAHRATVVPERA